MDFAATLLALSGRAVCLVAYTVAGATCIGLAFLGPWLVKCLVWHPYKTSLKHLPGPKRRGLFVGDLSIFCETETSKEFSERLVNKFGRNLRIQGLGYMDDRLVTFDPVTINYILGPASDRFTKPIQMRRYIAKRTGGDTSLKAVSVSEGAVHTRLRKIMAPAFAPSTIKGLSPIFIRKANELCDAWRAALSESNPVDAPGIEISADGSVALDVHNWLGRATFDIIGLAAFGYSFDSLKDNSNELFASYMRLHEVTKEGTTLRDNLCLTAPWLERVWQTENSRAITESAKVVDRTSKMLLEQRRATAPEGDSKSILGLLLRCNHNAAPEDRLSDEELLAQIDGFLLAGADSTSIALVWGLYALSRNPKVQQALREELAELNLGGEHDFASDSGIECDYATPDPVAQFAAIDALPMLDRVVREILRLYTPVHSTLRTAEQDDIVPFTADAPPRMADGSISRAVVTGHAADGTIRTGIRVRKGEFIHLPYEGMNTARAVWGEDAHEFNPDRWLNLPSAVKNNIGLVSNLMTFSVGPHACPGSRLAIAEIKTILAHVVSSFEFDEMAKILPHNMMVVRPWVDDEWEKGHRLPLRVRAL
ncbi:cytochrome P450 family protein [Ceratobasidium sp. AG-Ba]|nr:cytochrome P450 family protein [Ceratobasidium sp. AG-Ba]